MSDGERTPGLSEFAAAASAPVARPFWLHDPDRVSFVGAGAIDVFVVRQSDGEVTGAREHLYRAVRGQIVLGINPGSVAPEFGLLAVPLPGAAVTEVRSDELLRRAGDDTRRGELLELAEAWIAALTRGLPRELAPGHVNVLEVGDETSVRKDELLAPVRRLVWMRLTRGRAVFMGEEGVEIEPDSDLVPLPVRNDVWFRALEDAAALTVDPGEVIATGRLWRALQTYHRLALRYVLARARRRLDAEADRLATKAAGAGRVMQNALERIVQVTAGRSARAVGAPDPDSLFAACEILGERLGVCFVRPPRGSRRAIREPVSELAASSNLRMRRVALKHDWWTTDNGPLLGRFSGTQDWVALLPERGGYELHDPQRRSRDRIGPALAERLHGFAMSFYRPLPDGPVGLAGLLALGLRGMRSDIVWMLVLGALIGLLGLATPVLTGKLIDTYIPSANKGDVLIAMLALVAAALASAMFGLARSMHLLRVEGHMDGAIHAAIWDRVLSLPIAFFSRFTAGDLAMRLNGINVIRRALSGAALASIFSALFSSFNLVLLFVYNATLAWFAVGMLVLALAVTFTCGWIKLRYEREGSAISGRLAGMVFQYLLGIVKLRMAVAEARAFANWAAEFARLRTLNFRAQNVANVEQTFYSGYEVVVSAVLFAAVGMLILPGPGTRFTTGEFVAFIAAFGAFFTAVIGMSATVIGLLNLVPVYERAAPVLVAAPEADQSKIHPGELQGRLDVVKLAFSYVEGRDIFTDVSFSVRPGGFIAIVGPSGSGKSTLFRLLLGFAQPASGSIYYDNQALSDLDIRAVRRQIGVVLQTSQLMPGSLYSNIVGSTLLTIDDAWEAARLCGLEEDIEAMPMGMHTVISEGSSTLSGGQRQRILIARAIVQRPRLLLLDEATSALDNRTQALVTRNLAALKTTRIVIGHRLSTVANADRILVLQDGRIVQNGSYAALIDQPGPFAELARRQLA